MRHVLGEDLNVGCCLSWGPCWYHQKRYFEGKVHPAVDADAPAPLRRRSVRLPVEPLRATSACCGCKTGLSRHEADRGLAELGPADLPMGEEAGRRRRLRPHRLGPGTGQAGRPAASELPNYVLPPMDGIGANEYLVDVAHGRLRLHLDRGHAGDLGTEHLVSHAQLRLPLPDQRRDRLPVHLRRARRPRPQLRPPRRQARLRPVGRGHQDTAAATSATARAT